MEGDEQGDIIDKEFGAFPLEKSFPNLTTDRPPAVDLYSDLFEGDGKEEGITWLRARISALQNEVDETGKRAAEMEERITSLTHDNEELQQANDTLTRNISVLFNTAKLEIQRKDDQIKELRQELMRIKRK